MIAVDYDPIALGYIAGLPRPGGNITGVFLRQIEVTANALSFSRTPCPSSRASPCSGMGTRRTIPGAAEAAGFRRAGALAGAGQSAAYDFEGAFAAAAREGADALMSCSPQRL